MHICSAVVYILPKTTVHDIEKILKGFLWCKRELQIGKAKIAWKSVCRLNSQEGLGLKPLGPWNEVLTYGIL